jgi:hypothetical protein
MTDDDLHTRASRAVLRSSSRNDGSGEVGKQAVGTLKVFPKIPKDIQLLAKRAAEYLKAAPAKFAPLLAPFAASLERLHEGVVDEMTEWRLSSNAKQARKGADEIRAELATFIATVTAYMMGRFKCSRDRALSRVVGIMRPRAKGTLQDSEPAECHAPPIVPMNGRSWTTAQNLLKEGTTKLGQNEFSRWQRLGSATGVDVEAEEFEALVSAWGQRFPEPEAIWAAAGIRRGYWS